MLEEFKYTDSRQCEADGCGWRRTVVRERVSSVGAAIYQSLHQQAEWRKNLRDLEVLPARRQLVAAVTVTTSVLEPDEVESRRRSEHGVETASRCLRRPDDERHRGRLVELLPVRYRKTLKTI